MRKIVMEKLEAKISGYRYVSEYVELDLLAAIRAGRKPEWLLQRFIEGCQEPRWFYRDLPGYSPDSRYCAIVKTLIRAGAPLETDCSGYTALIDASEKGEVKTVKFLLEKGAKVNAEDKSGKTALDYAAFYGRPEVVALLKAHGGRLGRDGRKA